MRKITESFMPKMNLSPEISTILFVCFVYFVVHFLSFRKEWLNHKGTEDTKIERGNTVRWEYASIGSILSMRISRHDDSR